MESPGKPHAHEIGRRTYLIADVQPLDTDGVRTVQVGTTLWVLLLLCLLPFWDRLRAHGQLWWLGTCLAGALLGLLGLAYCYRRRRLRRAPSPPG